MTYIDSAIEFIDTFSKELIGLDFCNPNTDGVLETVKCKLEEYNRVYSSNIEYRHGMSRIVFVGKNFAVKIDYGLFLTDRGGCKEEKYGYELAKENRKDYLFAPITSIKRNDIDFYIMPKVSTAEDLGYPEEVFSDSLTDEELTFLLNNFVDDFHDENVGFLNGRWVLIDYAWNYIQKE